MKQVFGFYPKPHSNLSKVYLHFQDGELFMGFYVFMFVLFTNISKTVWKSIYNNVEPIK